MQDERRLYNPIMIIMSTHLPVYLNGDIITA